MSDSIGNNIWMRQKLIFENKCQLPGAENQSVHEDRIPGAWFWFWLCHVLNATYHQGKQLTDWRQNGSNFYDFQQTVDTCFLNAYYARGPGLVSVIKPTCSLLLCNLQSSKKDIQQTNTHIYRELQIVITIVEFHCEVKIIYSTRK